MGMHFISTNKRMNILKKLIAPITWFHTSSELQDKYKFKLHPNKEDTIIGYWSQNSNSYEITCPAQIREILITVLNLASKIYL